MVYKAGSNRLFLNVGYVLDEGPIRDHFSQFGRVLDVYLPRSKKTDATLGYGFATFESADEVERALAAGQEHLIDGVSVKVNRAGPRPNYDEAGPVAGPHGTGPRLYIGGVPPSLEPEAIREHFSRWGSVQDIYFPPQRSGKRSLYCFVRFASYSEAKRAYTESQRRIAGQDVDAINLAKDRLQPKDPQVAELGPGAAAPEAAPLGAAFAAARPLAPSLGPGLVGNLALQMAAGGASALGMLPMVGGGTGIKPAEAIAMMGDAARVGGLTGAELGAGLPWGLGGIGPGLFPGLLVGTDASSIRMSGYGAPAGAPAWGSNPMAGGLVQGAIGRIDDIGGYGPQRRHSHGSRPLFNPY